MPKSFLGIEIGGTKLQMVIGNEQGHIFERRRFVVDSSKGAGGIRSAIEAELPALISKGSPSAIGIGFGGPVDVQTGRVARSHQIEGWSDFSLRDWIGD